MVAHLYLHHAAGIDGAVVCGDEKGKKVKE
jgi:hypothetical protein